MAIEQAFEKLRERVKPAVLDPTSFANGQILKAYLDSKGFDLANADDDALATALYEAVTVEAAKLKWLVLPKKLQLPNAAIRNQTTSKHDQDAFSDKVKKADEATAYQKTQDAAKKQLDELIENILFVDGFHGRIAHGKTEAIKINCHAHVEKAIKGKRDLTVVAKEIQKYINDEYEKAERATERV